MIDTTNIRTCHRCGGLFSEEIENCPKDGEKLIYKDMTNLIGHEIDNRFMILDILGEGGWGVVYKAYQRSVERTIALKVLRPGLSKDIKIVERFLIEAKAASKLKHPNSITLHDFGKSEDGTLYIAMELLEGQTLSDLMEKEKTIEPRRCVYLMTQVCESLAEAHAKGIIHRDLKPENIFLAEGFGRKDFVKVLDFGIAKITEEENKTPLTSNGFVFGSPIYMSPEQAQGKDVGAASDIYSMGVILFEMLAGQPPFDDDKPLGILMKHVHEPPPKVTEVSPSKNIPEGIVSLVDSALSKNPESRPKTAQVFKKLLINSIQVKKETPPEKKFVYDTEEKSDEIFSQSKNLNIEVDIPQETKKRRVPLTTEEIIKYKISEQVVEKKIIEKKSHERHIRKETTPTARRPVFSDYPSDIGKKEINKRINIGIFVSLIIGAVIIVSISLAVSKIEENKFDKDLEELTLENEDFFAKINKMEERAGLKDEQNILIVEPNTKEKSSKFVELNFRSRPPNATVKLNGRTIGNTPLTIYEKYGEDVVSVEFMLSVTKIRKVQIIPNKNQDVEIDF